MKILHYKLYYHPVVENDKIDDILDMPIVVYVVALIVIKNNATFALKQHSMLMNKAQHFLKSITLLIGRPLRVHGKHIL